MVISVTGAAAAAVREGAAGLWNQRERLLAGAQPCGRLTVLGMAVAAVTAGWPAGLGSALLIAAAAETLLVAAAAEALLIAAAAGAPLIAPLGRVGRRVIPCRPGRGEGTGAASASSAAATAAAAARSKNAAAAAGDRVGRVGIEDALVESIAAGLAIVGTRRRARSSVVAGSGRTLRYVTAGFTGPGVGRAALRIAAIGRGAGLGEAGWLGRLGRRPGAPWASPRAA